MAMQFHETDYSLMHDAGELDKEGQFEGKFHDDVCLDSDDAPLDVSTRFRESDNRS